jgi:hypothetical protein
VAEALGQVVQHWARDSALPPRLADAYARSQTKNKSGREAGRKFGLLMKKACDELAGTALKVQALIGRERQAWQDSRRSASRPARRPNGGALGILKQAVADIESELKASQPAINVHPTPVHVHVPKAEPPVVNVHLPDSKRISRLVERDADGKIAAVHEVEQ